MCLHTNIPKTINLKNKKNNIWLIVCKELDVKLCNNFKQLMNHNLTSNFILLERGARK